MENRNAPWGSQQLYGRHRLQAYCSDRWYLASAQPDCVPKISQSLCSTGVSICQRCVLLSSSFTGGGAQPFSPQSVPTGCYTRPARLSLVTRSAARGAVIGGDLVSSA